MEPSQDPIPLRAIVLMGVSGSGKTTVGQSLADRLKWDFYDGDDFHPAANVSKMASGTPLSEADRLPWLGRLRVLLNEIVQGQRGPAVLACSALRQSYREILIPRDKSVALVHLRGDRETIKERLRTRSNHFMPPQLLDSQFQALEEPREATIVDISLSPNQIVDTILARLFSGHGRGQPSS